METERTDKTTLFKGVKILAFALLSIFIGPILLTIALSDKQNAMYIPLLIIACLICCIAVFLIFKGIQTIMNSMFKKK